MMDAWLIHRCAIERVGEGVDAYGNRSQVWSMVAADVACRLVEGVEQVIRGVQAEAVVVSGDRIFFGREAEVQERDRVSNLTLETEVRVEGYYVVEAVLKRRSRAVLHQTAKVKHVA